MATADSVGGPEQQATQSSPEAAVVDANVLFQFGLRDFLLSMAFCGVFLPAWSEEIHDEWMRNRVREYGDPMERLEYAKREMEKHFQASCFDPDQEILNDVLSKCRNDEERKDAHVVMTAIQAEASTIITFNSSDFPKHVLEPYGLRHQKPDSFCARIFPDRVQNFVEGSRVQRERLHRPKRSAEDYIRHLRDGLEMRQTAELLRPHIERI